MVCTLWRPLRVERQEPLPARWGWGEGPSAPGTESWGGEGPGHTRPCPRSRATPKSKGRLLKSFEVRNDLERFALGEKTPLAEVLIDE